MTGGCGFWTGFGQVIIGDRKSTRLNSSHGYISYAVFCLKKKKNTPNFLHLSRKHTFTPNTITRSPLEDQHSTTFSHHLPCYYLSSCFTCRRTIRLRHES